jgi:hypothetical protein
MTDSERPFRLRPTEVPQLLIWGSLLLAAVLVVAAILLPHTSCEERASGLTEGVLGWSLATFSALLVGAAFWSLWQEGIGLEPAEARARFRFGAAMIVVALFACGVAAFGSRRGDLLPEMYSIGLIVGVPASAIALGWLAMASRRADSVAEMAEAAPGVLPGYLVLVALFTYPALTGVLQAGTSGGLCLG